MISEKISLFRDKFKKSAKRKGFTLMEILVACAIIIALSVGAFFAYQQAQQTRKMAQMNQDMEAIANAALSYEAMSTDSTLPDSIATMITGLAADKSIDGSEHKLLTQFKGGAEATDVTDPWGAAYTYSATDRTVTCTPKDASGTAMSTVTRHF